MVRSRRETGSKNPRRKEPTRCLGLGANKKRVYLDPKICKIIAFYGFWATILPTVGGFVGFKKNEIIPSETGLEQILNPSKVPAMAQSLQEQLALIQPIRPPKGTHKNPT